MNGKLLTPEELAEQLGNESEPLAARPADPPAGSQVRSLLADVIAAHHRHKRQSPAGRREW